MDELSDSTGIELRLIEKALEARIPYNVGFELTPVCNLQCDMCYVRKPWAHVQKEGGINNLDFWLDKARQLKTLGCYVLLLTGGEPLLYPHFFELYSELAKMGFALRVNTNATLITPEIADLLANNRPKRVSVTVYGASNETYEKLCHVKDGYDKCIRGINLLNERGINVCMNLTLVNTNQGDYQRILEFAKKEDIPVKTASYISVFSNKYISSSDILAVRNNPYQAAENEIFALYSKDPQAFRNWLIDKQAYLRSNYHPIFDGCELDCKAGKCSCWVNWRGEMQACVDLAEPKVSLHHYTVSEAWEILKNACAGLAVHTECKDCKLKPLCDVCYANATNEKKHCGSLDYLCQMAEAKARIISSINIQFHEKPYTPSGERMVD